MIAAGLARNSNNDRIKRIRRAFRWAASVEMIPNSIVQALGTVPGPQKRRSQARETEPVGPVAIEVVDQTMPYLSRPVAAMARLQLLTAMRPGEAFGMRARDLKVDGDAWTYRPSSHKTTHRARSRAIPLGPKAVELIRPLLKPDLDAYQFDPREAVADHHAKRSAGRKSRTTPSGVAKRSAEPGANHARRSSRASYLNAVVRACDRAFPHPTIRKARGKPQGEADRAELLARRKAHRWHPNQLRHTAATLVRSRFGLEAAQALLGQARSDTTIIYAERDLAKAREVMREIG